MLTKYKKVQLKQLKSANPNNTLNKFAEKIEIRVLKGEIGMWP
jgi:hypothetical protein